MAPPVAAIVKLYAELCVAFGKGDMVVIETAETIVWPKTFKKVELTASVTSTLKLATTGVVGVPESVPADDMESPAGIDPASQV